MTATSLLSAAIDQKWVELDQHAKAMQDRAGLIKEHHTDGTKVDTWLDCIDRSLTTYRRLLGLLTRMGEDGSLVAQMQRCNVAEPLQEVIASLQDLADEHLSLIHI